MPPVRLVVADVDGTLLTNDKLIAPSTSAAVKRLRDNGVAFTLASARPPLGLLPAAEPLGVTGPVAAFNGGTVTALDPAFVYHAQTLSERLVQPVADTLGLYGLDMWAYCGNAWYVTDTLGLRVGQEAADTRMWPDTVGDWSQLPGRPSKLVGVGKGPAQLRRARESLDARLRTALTAAESTPFYLDITPPGVNKGTAVQYLAAWHAVPLESVMVIGDGMVDVPMFLEKGVLSVAMGNAPFQVQAMAGHVTATNEDDGFARAVEEFVLA